MMKLSLNFCCNFCNNLPDSKRCAGLGFINCRAIDPITSPLPIFSLTTLSLMSTDQNPETCLFRRRSSNTTLMNKKSPIQRLNLAKGLMMLGDFLPGSPLTKLTMLLHVYKGNQKYQSKNSSSTQSQEKIMIIINNGRKKK